MKQTQRIVSFTLAIIMFVVGIVTVSATQSKSENFNTSYTLTGNYRDDIVAVAKAQYLKTKSQLGYTEGWCADFVCDCAKLAGIPDFPNYGGVDGLKTRLITWGGTWHSSSSSYSPQKGDIVFLSTFPSYSSSGGLDHVGIVTANGFNSNGAVATIEGNTSSSEGTELCVNTKNRKPMPASSSSSDTMYVVGYVTLAEKLTTVITSLTIETMPDKVYYPVGGMFDMNGLTARVTYSDGYTKLIYPEWLKFTNTKFTEPGIQFIRADYNGIYTSFPVVVYSEFPEIESQTAIPADRNQYVNFEWSVTDMNGRLVTKDTLDGTTGVIIFFKATGDCYNSNQTIKSIAASDWVKNDKVQVVAVDVTSSSNEVLTEYKNTYATDCNDIVFAKDTSGALSKFKQELDLDNTVAANIITDDTGAVRYAWTGNYNADYYQNALANILEGINNAGDASYYDICVEGEYNYDMANAVFEKINQYRSSLGLSELVMDAQLSACAMQRAAELSINYSHTRPDYSNCFSILPIEFQSATMRENIAAGYISAEAVASAWINSYGHNENIVASDNALTGIGCFSHNGKYYWVQIFSAKDTVADIEEYCGTEKVSVDVRTTGNMLNLKAQTVSEKMFVGENAAVVLSHTNEEFFSALTLLNPTFVESSTPDVASVAVDLKGTFITAKSEGNAVINIGFISENGTLTTVEINVSVVEPFEINSPEFPSNDDTSTESTEPTDDSEDNCTKTESGEHDILQRTLIEHTDKCIGFEYEFCQMCNKVCSFKAIYPDNTIKDVYLPENAIYLSSVKVLVEVIKDLFVDFDLKASLSTDDEKTIDFSWSVADMVKSMDDEVNSTMDEVTATGDEVSSTADEAASTEDEVSYYELSIYSNNGELIETIKTTTPYCAWKFDPNQWSYTVVITAFNADGDVLAVSNVYSIGFIMYSADWWGYYGDVDLNGKVNVKDATLIQKYLANLVELDKYPLKQADVNSDKKVTIKDATVIQKHSANIEVESDIGREYWDGYTVYSDVIVELAR